MTEVMRLLVHLFFAVLIWFIYKVLVLPTFFILNRFPGPKTDSLIFGNLLRVWNSESDVAHESWHEKYGPVIAYRTFLGSTRLSCFDPKALNHILVAKAYDYPKPMEVIGDTRLLFTNGLAFSEGEVHKRQRRILNPAFSPPQIKAMRSIIYLKAYQLRDKWIGLIQSQQDHTSKIVIDVTASLARTVLDIIGLVAFGQEFNSLDNQENQLAKAFSGIFATDIGKLNSVKLLQLVIMGRFPHLLKVFDNPRYTQIMKDIDNIEKESKKLFECKKAELLTEEKDGAGKKDLLGTLVKANLMASQEKDRMSDREVMGQMSTFLLGGHETTASAMTWTLWLLAKHPEVQGRLRKEIQRARLDSDEAEIPIDELNKLPCLDAICKEVLRLVPPVSLTIRVATKADKIPLSKPVPVKNRFCSGSVLMDHIPVQPGQRIIIPISSYNRSTQHFSKDADRFIPERWLEGRDGEQSSEAMKKNFTAWAGLMTFLGGPRACIGYRLSVMEIKILTVVLIEKLRFEERDELGGPNMERRMSLAVKPRITGLSEGSQMPLRVSLV